jgi:hypothetical protein
MYWNHRLVNVAKDNDGEDYFQVSEVFYNDAGQPVGYTSADVSGETMEEVLLTLQRFAEAVKHPILNAETDFIGEFEEDDDEPTGDLH